MNQTPKCNCGSCKGCSDFGLLSCIKQFFHGQSLFDKEQDGCLFQVSCNFRPLYPPPPLLPVYSEIGNWTPNTARNMRNSLVCSNVCFKRARRVKKQHKTKQNNNKPNNNCTFILFKQSLLEQGQLSSLYHPLFELPKTSMVIVCIYLRLNNPAIFSLHSESVDLFSIK